MVKIFQNSHCFAVIVMTLSRKEIILVLGYNNKDYRYTARDVIYTVRAFIYHGGKTRKRNIDILSKFFLRITM